MAQVTISPGDGDERDTWFESSVPDLVREGGTQIQMGYFSSTPRRIVIEMTLPDFLSDSTLFRAILRLSPSSIAQSAGGDFSIHRLTRPEWVASQATWNSFSTDNPWATAGGDYSEDLIYSFVSPLTIDPFDLEEDVNGVKILDFCIDAIENRDRKLILLFRKTVESGGNDSWRISSGEETLEFRPTLIFEFIDGFLLELRRATTSERVALLRARGIYNLPYSREML